jgi:hypothetical protein
VTDALRGPFHSAKVAVSSVVSQNPALSTSKAEQIVNVFASVTFQKILRELKPEGWQLLPAQDPPTLDTSGAFPGRERLFHYRPGIGPSE